MGSGTGYSFGCWIHHKDVESRGGEIDCDSSSLEGVQGVTGRSGNYMLGRGGQLHGMASKQGGEETIWKHSGGWGKEDVLLGEVRGKRNSVSLKRLQVRQWPQGTAGLNKRKRKFMGEGDLSGYSSCAPKSIYSSRVGWARVADVRTNIRVITWEAMGD